ncbi:phosphodiester glycosidase family protein [Longimicrobium sp.]|uniref:phosphodiester glycosidase family protein n=1 Tax=Longimicrobium sp. TaxID=2029185 RepID=UPI002E3040D1|nr:phosphodiester glycosidase family protein [Longimicrobium sp.]HEX6040337.1 phosphodiester glycosidase family protein [Longimicrobium sp.]
MIHAAAARGTGRARRELRRALLVGVLLAPGAAAAQGLPRSALAVERNGAWTPFWRSEQAPARWTAPHPALNAAVRWRTLRPGLEHAELRISGSGEARRLRVVLVRADPRRLRFRLERATRMQGLLPGWTVDSLPDAAVLALNAGQFSGARPWGWVVRDGREEQPPGQGPLSMAFVVDGAGGVRLVTADELPAVRARGGIAAAFQSYPALLVGDGQVPAQLAAAGRGVDVAHRDSRLALGLLPDGRILVALTRFDALGGAVGELPVGPTSPEMAGLMGALGCRRAVLLDGGISGQMLVRPRSGAPLAWRAWRRVPLGLVAVPR